MKKYFKCLFLIAIVAVFSLSFAVPNAGAVTIAELISQIQALQAQLTQLQAQQGTTTAWCHDFNTNLRIGDQGDEIEALHAVLEKEGFNVFAAGPDASVSEVRSFSEETASAVSEFQEKYASEILTPYRLKRGTGFVGKSTRAKLNKLYGCSVATPTPIPLPTPTPTPTPAPTVLGDVNGDGKVDSGDSILVLQYAKGTGKLTSAQLSVADVNKDGKITANDGTIILQYSAGNFASLPVNVKVGDVNGDGVVDSGDALIVQQYVAGTGTLTALQTSAADVNNDGQITKADSDTILAYTAGNVSALPVAYGSSISGVAPTAYTLSVTKAGTGSGTVKSYNYTGLNCGTMFAQPPQTCSFAFNRGLGVELTPYSDSGSTFTGWSGACSGTGSCIVTMDAAKSVTATFTTITITPTATTPTPTISSLSPTSGPVGGLITVKGTGFANSAWVILRGGTSNYNLSFNASSISSDGTQLIFAVPNVVQGQTYSIYVINVAGQPISNAGSFAVASSGNPSIAISSVTPSTMNQNDQLVIIGTGFSSTTNYVDISYPNGGLLREFGPLSSTGNGTNITFTPRLMNASDMATGDYKVAVIKNPGGYVSNALDLHINAVSTPVPTTYTLSVTKSGTGFGTITDINYSGKINCGSTCSASFPDYNVYAQVLLKAAPAAGSIFTGWSGACVSGSGGLSDTCVVDLSASSKSVTATFTTTTTTNTTTAAAPVITSVSPTSARAGSSIYVVGSNFSIDSNILLDGTTIIPPASQTSTTIIFNLPSYASVGSHSVQVKAMISGVLSNSVSLNIVVSTTATPVLTAAILDSVKAQLDLIQKAINDWRR